jgi:predicted acylesterase/phospholipase RssA
MEKKSAKPGRLKARKRARLPKKPFSNVAISLSGGGFRASAFHMGVLAYLSYIKFDNEDLLSRIRIIATSSAGTFVGVKYAATLKKGGNFRDFYSSIYSFLMKNDLVEDALQYLSDDQNWKEGRQRTLINAFAAIYHRDFENEHFGLLWKAEPEIHLKEISYNATEFNFAMPFRFQKSERLQMFIPGNTHDCIGNKKIHIPYQMAKEVRLADIIAASSCFPFGFEPINFPDDFIHRDAVKLRDKSLLPQNASDGDKIVYPIGLMDGGIDDNQGVDAVIMAEERMRHYPEELREYASDDKKAVDLYIISDATAPKRTGYIRSTNNKIRFVGNWNFKKLRNFGLISASIGALAFVIAFFLKTSTWIVLWSAFGTVGMLTALVLLIFSRGFAGLTRWLGVPVFFAKRLKHFDKLRFGLLYNLYINRRKSSMKLVTDVFIRHMRWLSYERVYGDYTWKPRLIMNAIFDMTDIEVEKRKIKYPHFPKELANPGEEIVNVATKANSMATTLWFSPEELKGEKHMLDSIISTGHFNICYNLLEYFEKFIYNGRYKTDYSKYSDETKAALEEMYTTLKTDWEKFKQDPYWFIKQWNQEVNSAGGHSRSESPAEQS